MSVVKNTLQINWLDSCVLDKCIPAQRCKMFCCWSLGESTYNEKFLRWWGCMVSSDPIETNIHTHTHLSHMWKWGLYSVLLSWRDFYFWFLVESRNVPLHHLLHAVIGIFLYCSSDQRGPSHQKKHTQINQPNPTINAPRLWNKFTIVYEVIPHKRHF